MKVKVIKAHKLDQNITVGKTYEAVGGLDVQGDIKILNDNNEVEYIFKDCFEIVKEKMIVIPTLRAFVVKCLGGSGVKLTDQSNGHSIIFRITDNGSMNDASMILSGRGINIVSCSSLTKGRGVLLSDDMDTPLLNV